MPEVCVGITQMRQKSISRFLTLGITLSIAGAGFSPRIGRQGICFTCTHSRSWVICAQASMPQKKVQCNPEKKRESSLGPYKCTDQVKYNVSSV